MDKRSNKRRPSRPVSELITLFDHQQAEKSKASQWRSENALNLPKSPQMTHKRNSTGLSRSGNSEISKSSESVQVSARSKSCVTREGKGTDKSEPSLKPIQTHGKTQEKPKKKAMEAKEAHLRGKNELNVPESLRKEPKQEKKSVENKSDGDSESDSENCTRKKFPLDDSLAVLRREMHSLRKQDVELMSQLLALNSSIQDIKSSSSSMSNYSDTSDAETEIENNPRQAWHQRDSSTGSDTSDFEVCRGNLRPTYKQSNVNRDSLGSEVSGYYSNPSPRSSYHGSKSSLNGYDISGAESFVSRSECCCSQPSSPVSPDPPFAYHCRQKPWLNQDFLGLGMTGSDPMLNRDFPDGDRLQPPVQSRAFHAGDDKVRRMSLQQKRLYSRRNTACSVLSDMSRSGSDHSLSGYDVDSDNSRTSVQSSRLQQWQRSKSTCALNNNSTSRPPIQNTIKVDLRKNPPTPGTAIELILPIQPLQPSRRNSGVRMAERKQVNKLNSLSKRQSTIW